MEEKNTHLDEYQEEQQEDTLSLTDFPISANEGKIQDFVKIKDCSRSSSDPSSNLFEFFSGHTSDYIMCHAEDIIFSGKLVPLKDKHLIPNKKSTTTTAPDDKPRPFHQRRSGSLSELKTCSHSQSNVTQHDSRLMRNSRSLDYRKLRRNSSLSSEPPPESIHRNSSTRSSKSDASTLKASSKPRWYIFMFGLVRFPPEIDLQDIKSRKVHRNPVNLFPSFQQMERKDPASRNDRSKSSWPWGLLRVLSCKDHASLPVTASFTSAPSQSFETPRLP